jgi:hypothetical protein
VTETLKTRRFRVLAAVLAIVGTGAGVGGAVATSRHAEGGCRVCGGPLRFESNGLTVSAGLATEAGEAISNGPLLVSNSGEETLTLHRAWLVHKQPGIEVLGFYTVAAGQQPQFTATGFDPQKGLPLTGRAVEPQGETRVIIGTKLITDGEQAYRGVALEYTVGEKKFVKVFDISLRLCAPFREYSSKACRTPIEDPPQPCLLPQDPTPTSDLRVCGRKPGSKP